MNQRCQSKIFLIILFLLIATRTGYLTTPAKALPNMGFNNLLLTKKTIASSGTITTSIEAENDDTEIWLTNLYFNGKTGGSDMYMGADNNVPVWGSLRFRLQAAIPAGATITSANFSVYGTDSFYFTNSVDYLHVLANDSSDAPQVTTYEDAPGGATGYYFTSAPGATSAGANVIIRWPTAGGLTWDQGAGLNIGPDISPLIQFLVNKYGGLNANAHVQFWIYSQVNHIAGPEVGIADYNHPTLPAPMLIINWTK